jgi:phage baseplate assembly protein W
LFETQSPEVAYTLQSEISNLLKNYEPRVKVDSVIATYPEESYDLNVRISYDIVGLPVPVQTIEFVLQPTRI